MGEFRAKFMEVYSVLKSELLNDPDFEFTDVSRDWVDRVFHLLVLYTMSLLLIFDLFIIYLDFWSVV